MRRYRVTGGSKVDWSVENDGPRTPLEMRERIERALRLGFTIRKIEPQWANFSVENDAVVTYLTINGGSHVTVKDSVA